MKEVLKSCKYFKIYKQNKFHAQLSGAWKKFYNLGAWFRPKDPWYMTCQRISTEKADRTDALTDLGIRSSYMKHVIFFFILLFGVYDL